jgi:hypothetical protein
LGYSVPPVSTIEPKGLQVVVPLMPSKQLEPTPKSSALGQTSGSSTMSLVAWGAIGAVAGVALSMILK